MLNVETFPLGDVHPTAVIDESAALGAGVIVGPYAVIGANVVLGEGARIGPHVLIERDTVVGARCAVHKGAVLGSDPQDLKYGGEPTQLVIGDGTVIREFATLNRGTAAHGRTEVGRECLLMAYSHVAHDCILADHVILANSVNLGGHVVIEEWAIVGGATQVHQFVRIGSHAYVGGASAVRKDIPPYVKASGNPLSLYGLNSVGLQRREFSEEARLALKRAYRILFHSSLNVSHALEKARAELAPIPEVEHFLAFVEQSERGITL